MKSLTTFLGPPGTGKTERLLREVEALIKAGTWPDRIGYASFTNAAVDVAKARADRPSEELPYFRTLHSLCFRLCGLSTEQVMQRPHYDELGGLLGLDLTGDPRLGDGEPAPGDKALAVVELARALGQGVRDTWESADTDTPWELVDLVARALSHYKEANLLVDYTGMLERYLGSGPVPDLDVFVVDEAQDLTPLQWRVVHKLAGGDCHGILAGDDDQMIYHWAGARFKVFAEVVNGGDRSVLTQSHRLPRKVHALATKLAAGIKQRLDKAFTPRDAEGELDYRASLEDVDLSEGSWLVLVRNRYMVRAVVEHCEREGIYYSSFLGSPSDWSSLKAASAWERLRKGQEVAVDELDNVRRFLPKGSYDRISGADLALARTAADDRERRLANPAKAIRITEEHLRKPWFEALEGVRRDEAEYIRAALRRGEKLFRPPRVRIGTIHGAKGDEADNVLLFTDQSFRTHETGDEDYETRVFYVGITRARERLLVVQPATPYHFNLEI